MPTAVPAPPAGPLTLVDWRDRVAALYAEVRADPDPASGHATWRAGRAELFATHPDSPVRDQPELREAGLSYWAYDPALRFDVALEPVTAGEEPDERPVDTGDDGGTTLVRVGRVSLDGLGTLDVWRLHQYGGGLFVPLRDGTSGRPGEDGASSYGGGRYLLDTAKGAHHGLGDGRLVLDLNFAYHPSCRYDPRWRCPLAPPGNTLTARVEAGERY